MEEECGEKRGLEANFWGPKFQAARSYDRGSQYEALDVLGHENE